MAVHDPISDGLTKIRNASRVRHPAVDIRFARFFLAILEVLKREGFIRTYKTIGDTPSQRMIRVYLKYAPSAERTGQKTSAIRQLVRVSKPGARIYRNAADFPASSAGSGWRSCPPPRGS